MNTTDSGQKMSPIEAVYNWYRNVIRNPKYRWWIIGGTLLYLLSPIDISPDFLPIVGWIDDGIIASVLVAELSQMLLERLKASNSSVDEATTTTNPGSTNKANTVDVNAVKID